MDLVKILRKVPPGIPLYSPVYGTITFVRVCDSQYPIRCKNKKDDIIQFTREGHYDDVDFNGECILFPSKDNRDWSSFQVVMDKDLPVMVYNPNLKIWVLAYYESPNVTKYTLHAPVATSWPYGTVIVPLSVFCAENPSIYL